MPVVAYHKDAVVEEVASAGPEACTLGGLNQRGPERVSDDVKTRVGGALWDAQIGLKSPAAKPLKGFGDAGVLEVVDFDGNTIRTVYTVRFSKAVYVLHAFQ